MKNVRMMKLDVLHSGYSLCHALHLITLKEPCPIIPSFKIKLKGF